MSVKIRVNKHTEEVPDICVKLVAGLRAVSRLENESFYSISFRNNLEEAKNKISQAVEVFDEIALNLPVSVSKNIKDRLNELLRFLNQHRSIEELKKEPVEAGTYLWIRKDLGQALKEAWEIVMFKCLT